MRKCACHFAEPGKFRQVLECASPLALFTALASESARGLAHSRTLPRWITRLAAGTLFVFSARLFAQTNPGDPNALPRLSPPYAEMPPTFWEQHGTLVLIIAFGII